MDQDERRTVELAKCNADAFGVLYDRHAAAIYRFVFARLRNAASAEDVTAEVFLKALRAISHYQPRERPFICWLYRIADNAVADHFRRQRPTAELSDGLPDGNMPMDDAAIRHLEVEDVWQLVERLPRQQRLAMILRFGQDRSDHEIALVMGKSDAAVKLLIFRGVGRLRLEVARRGLGPMPSALAAS